MTSNLVKKQFAIICVLILQILAQKSALRRSNWIIILDIVNFLSSELDPHFRVDIPLKNRNQQHTYTPNLKFTL